MRGAATKPDFIGAARHVAYAGGWKKFEPLWDMVIRARRLTHMLPVLESVLTGFGQHTPGWTLPGAKDNCRASATVESLRRSPSS
jgi:hypothetical protein